MRNIALILSYDGTNYFGWQRQERLVTIQGEVEKALGKITKEKITLEGCSRTDARVHALNYLCNFKTSCTIPIDRVPAALNSLLPHDIIVNDCFEAETDFHSRFSVLNKTYIYKIHNSKIRDPFLNNYTWHLSYDLDMEKMEQSLKYYTGTHDFNCFMAAGGKVKSTVRTIYLMQLSKNDDIINMEVTGDGFLYNMVRIIAGTLIYTGIGKIQPHEIEDIIISKDRTKAGITAPPQGLYLKNINWR